MTIELRSPDFDDGERIPDRYAKDHENVFPALEWSGVPASTRELALVVEDPDAPRGRFVHWTVSGLPPDVERLAGGHLPRGAIEGRNDFGDVGYGGPLPPKGDPPHRYVFTLFALDDTLELQPGADPRTFHDAVQGKELARAQLTGRYGR
jgi:Raf kinase inhibitor-like YbhB/YbcL family protein